MLAGAVGGWPIAADADPPPPDVVVRGSLERIWAEATDPTGAPVEDVAVSISPTGGSGSGTTASAVTDAFGGVLIDAEPGAYTVELSFPAGVSEPDWTDTRQVRVLEENTAANPPDDGDPVNNGNPRLAPSTTYGPDPAVPGYEAADASDHAANPACEVGTSLLFCQELELWQEIGTNGGGRTAIEVRDGTKLDALVQLPDGEGPFPVIVEYSLYEDVVGQRGNRYEQPGPGSRNVDRWLDLGYAVVGVQVRGLGCSGGWWDLNEPVQFTDGFDVVEVLARQPWSTGTVGMTGISGPGMMATFTASTRPPSLGAIAVGGVSADLEAGFPGGMFNDYVGGFGAWMQDRASHWSEQSDPDATFHWIHQRATGTQIAPAPAPDPEDPCAENHRLRGRAQQRAGYLAPDALDSPAALSQLDVLVPTARSTNIEVPTLLLGGWQDAGEHGSMLSLLGGWNGAPLAGTPNVASEDERGRLRPGIGMAIMTNGSHLERDNPAALMATAELFAIFVAGEVPSTTSITETERSALASGYDCSGGPSCRVDFRGMDAVQLPTVHDYGATLSAARAAWTARATTTPVTVLWESGAGRTPLNALDPTPGDPAPGDNEAGGLPYPNFTSAYSAWPPSQVGAGTALELGPDEALGPDAASSANEGATYRYDPLGREFATSLVPSNSAQEEILPTPWKWLPLQAGPDRTGVTFESEPLPAPHFHVGRGYADLWVRPTLSSAGEFDFDVEVNVIEVRPDGGETLVEAGRVRASKSKLTTESFGLWPQPDYAGVLADPVQLESGSWIRLRVPIQPYAHVFRTGSRVAIEVTTPGGSQPTWSSLGSQQHHVPTGATLDLEIGTGGDHASTVVLPVLPDGEQPVGDGDPRLSRQVRCGALRAQPCRATPHQMETPDVQPSVGAIEVAWRQPQSWMGVNARVAPTSNGGYGGGGAIEVTIKEHEPYSYAGDPAFAFTSPGTAVPAAPGRSYTAALRAKAAAGASLDGAAIGHVSFFDGSGQYLGGQAVPSTTITPPDENGWVLGTSQAVAPTGAVMMVVGASFEGEVDDQFFLDDASIIDDWDPAGTNLLTSSQRALGAPSAVDQVEAIEVRIAPAAQLATTSTHIVQELAPDATSLRVDGLTNDVDYQVQVRAKGPGGWGTPSPWSIPVTPRANLLGPAAAIVESEPWGWGGYGTTVARTTATTRTGAGALAITVDDPQGAFLQSSMGPVGRVPVVPGEDYAMRACFRGTTDARSVGVGLNFYEEGNYFPLDTAGALVTESTTGWECVSATGTAPLGADFAVIGAQVNGATAGEVHLADDFGIWEGTSAGAAMDNLLWSPAANIEGGWTGTDAAITYEWTAPGDPWAHRVTASGAQPTITTWDEDVAVTPPWTPAPDLRASLLLRSVGAQRTAVLELRLHDAAGTVIDTATVEAIIDDGWTRLSVPIDVTDPTTRASMRVRWPDAVPGDAFLVAGAELIADTSQP